MSAIRDGLKQKQVQKYLYDTIFLNRSIFAE